MKRKSFLLILAVVVSMGADGKPESAAQKRFRTGHHSQWSDTAPLQATVGMRYMPVAGLGREPGMIRRDPSDIVKVGDFKWTKIGVSWADSPNGPWHRPPLIFTIQTTGAKPR